MERLTNKYQLLINEVKKELQTFEIAAAENCMVSYTQIPWFPGGQLSLFLIKNSSTKNYTLVEKTWDQEYDLDRFSSRVYNLDRLCIKTKTIELSDNQQHLFESVVNDISNFPETLESEAGIMLDGIDYEMTIALNGVHKNYKWKLPTKDMEVFTPLINLMIETANGQVHQKSSKSNF